MINKMEPITMIEVKEIVGSSGKNKELVSFIKKFINLKVKRAKEFSTKIKELELMKIRPEHIVKIIDLVPEKEEELNKIFSDVSLNEDETKRILETIKEFK